MRLKQVAMLAMAVLLISTLGVAPVSAALLVPDTPVATHEEGVLAPKWDSTNIVVPAISHSGRKITLSLLIVPKSNTTQSQGTLYLEKKNGSMWEEVKSWPVSGTGTIHMTKTYRGKAGHTYRTRVIVTTGLDYIDVASSDITL